MPSQSVVILNIVKELDGSEVLHGIQDDARVHRAAKGDAVYR